MKTKNHPSCQKRKRFNLRLRKLIASAVLGLPGLDQKWFDKKNSKLLEFSNIEGNLIRRGGSVHGKTG
jgi:hypothetical protein